MHITVILLFFILCALVPGLLAGLVAFAGMALGFVAFIGGCILLAVWFANDPTSAIAAAAALGLFCLFIGWMNSLQKKSALRAEERKKVELLATQAARKRVEIVERLRTSSMAKVHILGDLTILRMQGRIVEHTLPNGAHWGWRVVESAENAQLEYADRMLGWPHQHSTPETVAYRNAQYAAYVASTPWWKRVFP